VISIEIGEFLWDKIKVGSEKGLLRKNLGKNAVFLG
jgi:hypothetical protein